MLENASDDEDDTTHHWDMNSLQNMLFDNEDTKENYNHQNIFLTYADNNIMLLKNGKQSTFEMQGACMDTAAEKTVIGIHKAKAYSKFNRISFLPKKKSVQIQIRG